MADFVTTAQYKTHEGISSSADDTRIGNLITSVSQLIKTYCGNTIIDYYSSNRTETFNIDWNTHIVQLTESPVNAIVSVEERTAYSESYQTLSTSDYEYYIDYESDSIVRTTKNGEPKSWAKGVGAVKITYNAGYSATPEDLKLACFDLLNYYLRDEHKERRTLGGAQVQQQGTSGIRSSSDFPDHIKRVLDLYRVVI